MDNLSPIRPVGISHVSQGQSLCPVVRFYFQLSTIYFLAAQRPAEFSNAFFQNVLQRRTAWYGYATSE